MAINFKKEYQKALQDQYWEDLSNYFVITPLDPEKPGFESEAKKSKGAKLSKLAQITKYEYLEFNDINFAKLIKNEKPLLAEAFSEIIKSKKFGGKRKFKLIT